LITVGIGILDYRGLKHMAKVPRLDAVIMAVVLIVTVFLDLLIAVGIGMVMAIACHWRPVLAMIKNRGAKPGVAVAADSSPVASRWDDQPWADEDVPPELAQKVLIERVSGPLFFAFATEFRRRLDGLSGVQHVILRLDRVPFVDQSGAYA